MSDAWPCVWDIIYTVPSSATTLLEWRPAAWSRTWFQRVKFLQAPKQKADAILRATRALGMKISQQVLIQETDNVGREAKRHYIDAGGFKGCRLQVVKREGRWAATVWPGNEDLGWPENKVARGKSLEECLRELQVQIRDKWSVKERRMHVGTGDKLMAG